MSVSFPLGSTRTALSARTEPLWVRWLLIGGALSFLFSFIFLPLALVFIQAFSKGVSYYFNALSEPNALLAAKLTLTAAGIAVPLNMVFGVAASWSIAKFDFPVKAF